MKHYTLLLVVTIALLSIFSFLNCADPLERGGANPVGGSTHVTDTVYNTDTVYVIDTLSGIDTIITIDTVIIIDTVTDSDTIVDIDTVTIIDTVVDSVIDVDTVIIVMPDTGVFRPLCGQIANNHQVITWMFRNPAGDYRLEFTAALEKVQPNQTLTVTIDGQDYLWDPVANREFIVEQYLNQYATIRIVPNKPPAAGHAIDVCLTVTAL